jgi:type I restriction enzyme, S subunit
MDKWRTITLEEGLDCLIDYRGKSPPKSQGGIPVISAKCIKNGRIVQPIEQTIKPSFYPVWMVRGFPLVGDIVMTTEGPLGEVARLDKDTVKFALAQRVVCMRGKRGVLDSGFLKFLLMSPNQQATLFSYATGTTVAGISQKSLRSVPISIPPYHEQVAIGELLGAIDDKIDLNRRMNGTLEAMARAVFKDWFIDFGPTRAKMEGRAPYLAPEIWALFPDRLDGDGKPEGWALQRIDDLLELAYGKALPATSRVPGKYPVYGSGGVTGYHAEALVRAPAVIVGRKGTVGSLYWEDRPCFPIDTVFYVIPKRASLILCYYILQSLGLESMNTDAAVPGLNRNNVYRLEGPWHVGNLAVHFDDIIGPIRSRMFAAQEESQTLVTLRDLLLPKLMSGEIRVKEVEKEVQAVA